MPPAVKLLILVLCVTIWGSSFILMKRGLLAFTPLEVSAVRMAVAGLVLLPVTLRFAVRRRFRYPWGLLILASLTGNLVPSFLFPLAQTQIDSSLAAALNALTPLFTLLVGAVAFGTRFTTAKVAGVLLGLVGAVGLVVIRADGQLHPQLFGLFIVLATFLYAINVNVVKRHLADIHPLEAAGLVLALAAVPSLGYALWAGIPARLAESPAALEAAAYVALLGAVGTAFALVIYLALLRVSTALFAASVTYLIPVVALAWGLADGERLHWGHGLGMALILGGIWLVNKGGNRK